MISTDTSCYAFFLLAANCFQDLATTLSANAQCKTSTKLFTFTVSHAKTNQPVCDFGFALPGQQQTSAI